MPSRDDASRAGTGGLTVGARTLLVLLVFWALAMIVPDLTRIAIPPGSFGFYANNDGLIYDVTGPFAVPAQSPAWKAGIREGDRVDLSPMRCLPYDARPVATCWQCSAAWNSCFPAAKRRSNSRRHRTARPGR